MINPELMIHILRQYDLYWYEIEDLLGNWLKPSFITN